MTLHVERTRLAWARTTLALIGLAAVVIRLRIDQPFLVGAATVAIGLLLLAMLRGNRRADGAMPAAVVGLVLVVVVVELVGILSR
ncbi:DUF202 domain-containing protein [Actinokineospora sp.]|uniref:DUF202 domain-containing protein n=1 Tax=Actinokineospora sp. TaxID=1872133 RepID=UPI003D6AC5A5